MTPSPTAVTAVDAIVGNFRRRASPMLLNTSGGALSSISLNSPLSGPTPTKVPRMLTPVKRSCSDANVLMDLSLSNTANNEQQQSPKDLLATATTPRSNSQSGPTMSLCLADRLVAAAAAAISGNGSTGTGKQGKIVF